MKWVSYLARWLCFGTVLALAAIPASAGQFSLVSGTGTGGAQHDQIFNGSTQVITVQPTSSIAAGSVAWVAMGNVVAGGPSGGWSVTDTKGNTWTSVGVEAEVASATQILWSILTTGLTTSDTVTATQASGPTDTTLIFGAFSATGTTSLDTSASNSGSNTNVASLAVGPTSSGTCNGTTNCRVAVCAMSLKDPATNTLDAGYTNIGQPTPGDIAVGYKFISSSTAAQTCTNTFSPSTRATGQLIVFQSAAAGGATLHNRALLGVGQ